MTKLILSFGLVLFSCSLVCCNSGTNTETPPTTAHTAAQDLCQGIDDIDACVDAGGIGTLVVETSVAQKMMTNFTNSFKKNAGADIAAFEPAFWLSKCEI